MDAAIDESRSSKVAASSRIAAFVSSMLRLIAPCRTTSARRQRSASSSFFAVSGAVSTRPICSICIASAPDSGDRSPMLFSSMASSPAMRTESTRSGNSSGARGGAVSCAYGATATTFDAVTSVAPTMSVPRNALTFAPVSALGPFHESISRFSRATSASTGSTRGMSARFRPSRFRVTVMPVWCASTCATRRAIVEAATRPPSSTRGAVLAGWSGCAAAISR